MLQHQVNRCNDKETVWMCTVYNITTYNIIISHAFPVLILSLPSGLTLCWQYLQGCISSCSCRAQCSGEPTWSLTPGSSHCPPHTLTQVLAGKCWEQAELLLIQRSLGLLEEMIMMVINVSKETGRAVLWSGADVKSLLFNINWTGLSTISLSRQHQL